MIRRIALSALIVAIFVGTIWALIVIASVEPPKRAPVEDALPLIGTPGRGWRGDGTGQYPAARPPVHWSETRGVLWKTTLKTHGFATPLLVDNRLFVTEEPDTLVALSAIDGHVLWRHASPVLDALSPTEKAEAQALLRDTRGLEEKAQEAEAQIAGLKRDLRKVPAPPGLPERIAALKGQVADMRARLDQAAPYLPPPDWEHVGNAGMTPVSDGRLVYVAFGTFVVAAYDLDGHRRWIRYLPHARERKERGRHLEAGASPRLIGGRLILPLVDLYALDPATGATVWTGPRVFDFGTPVWMRLGEEDLIVTAGGYVVRARDGQVLAGPITSLACKTIGPVVADDLVLLFGVANRVSDGAANESSGVGSATIEAYRFPRSVTQPFQPTLVWSKALSNEMLWNEPVLAGQHLFVADSSGKLQVFEVQTGALVQERHLGLKSAETFPSAALAGEHVYLSSASGDTVVLETKPPFAEIAHNVLDDDEMQASPLFEGDVLYLRTGHALYALAERALPETAAEAPDAGRGSEGGSKPLSLGGALAIDRSGEELLPIVAAPTPTETQEEPKSGLGFVRIPGGTFHFGCEPGDHECDEIESPGWSATVGSFWFGRTETTVAAYERCVSAGACTPSGNGPTCNHGLERASHPVNCIDWSQAQAFCRWIGGRLPSPEEWEFAAKNRGTTVYPWGNTRPTARHANICDRRCHRKYAAKAAAFPQDDGWAETAPVGSFPAGRSGLGLLDLAGNVWEWTEGTVAPDKVGVRGGGWDAPLPRWLRASYRPWVGPSNGDVNIGVRCVLPVRSGTQD